ncbi:phytoene/squalene synthase family protein [Labedaea rhizosphaerae]|uniref:Phytoene synthase n=1 Tax=Labedaea rhizosphaerae TaxID=598644 RepID=A0A4R6SAZ7_LABRH|nr:phytoene/squalene synthase family protein [Labedaea rhizosphaerae]TDP96045.1 phytoene synthase [Labedaea rhizosphaerae]
MTELSAAYAACREINAAHGRTYYLATRLLPASRRPAVHALYGFARLADDIVDVVDTPGADPAARLDELATAVKDAFAGRPSTPVLLALADTVRRYGIDQGLFDDFLASMRMDLAVTGYATMADLSAYMRGSAAAIGLQMLPVLGTVGPEEPARAPARALGEAFQLTNFLRDVGEDLDRGRLYLPADELAAFGVDRDRLVWARSSGKPDPRVRRAIAHLVGYTRAVYRRAEPGIALLRPESRPCVRVATTLYRGILDEIQDAGYEVLNRRAVVPLGRRLRVAGTGLLRARWHDLQNPRA